MSKPCGTCHYACDCREEKFATLEAALEAKCADLVMPIWIFKGVPPTEVQKVLKAVHDSGEYPGVRGLAILLTSEQDLTTLSDEDLDKVGLARKAKKSV